MTIRQFGCLFKGMATAADSSVDHRRRPARPVRGLNFCPARRAYTYPESLPIVNASGGPERRGLPDMPSKQFGGTWFRSPFLVTDKRPRPYQPNNEGPVRRASTLQFLFNSAFAEQDDR